MELFNFYQLVSIFIDMFAKNGRPGVIWGLPIGAALWIAAFILQGVGLYVMAKRLGLKKKGLAFVPFANVYYMGKIAGECGFFGHKMKNAGLYAMIVQIITTALALSYAASEWFLYYKYDVPFYTDSYFGTPQWSNLSGFAVKVYNFYVYGQSFLSILNLVCMILMIILLSGLYRKYSPKNYQNLALLSFLLPEARYIVIFVMRNREAVDFEEYMRKRREEYMRRQQQYYNTYGNPYNNPYGRPPYGGQGYNGQGYGGYQPPQPPKPEEPFEEFSSDKKGNASQDTPKRDENSDGFFD